MASVTPPAMPPTATPEAGAEITEQLVRTLVDSQFPKWSDSALTFVSEGWDNVMYRLGDRFAVRLPRREISARLAAAETVWLPRISRGWTFAAPVPVAVGLPSDEYPWAWSVVPWIDGSVAMDAPLSPDGAADLGAALAQVHVPAPAGAPHNVWRSIPLAERAERLDTRLGLLAEHPRWSIDVPAAIALFTAADERGELTWCHLDLHGRNILTHAIDGAGGRLAGILDWGDAALGDPCTDLGQALYLLGAEAFDMFARAYANAGGAGDTLAPRVWAEALTYAVTMAALEDEAYSASGWKALRELGVATAR